MVHLNCRCVSCSLNKTCYSFKYLLGVNTCVASLRFSILNGNPIILLSVSIHSSNELMIFCYFPLARAASLGPVSIIHDLKRFPSTSIRGEYSIAHLLKQWSFMWKAVICFRSWLRVFFSEEKMAVKFYNRSLTENVLQVGAVFVLFVSNWFQSQYIFCVA